MLLTVVHKKREVVLCREGGKDCRSIHAIHECVGKRNQRRNTSWSKKTNTKQIGTFFLVLLFGCVIRKILLVLVVFVVLDSDDSESHMEDIVNAILRETKHSFKQQQQHNTIQ